MTGLIFDTMFALTKSNANDYLILLPYLLIVGIYKKLIRLNTKI